MLAVVGTIPDDSSPLFSGEVTLQHDKLYGHGYAFTIERGTPALIASAVATLTFFQKTPPFVYVVGDTGRGDGSRRLYEYLVNDIGSRDFLTITFHYLQPDVDWCNRIMFAIESMSSRPVLIADAGFMYMAKMSGNAPLFDLFTPDAGELAFLADEEAPHPFYTRGFILHEETLVPDLIKRAYLHGNASHYLLVKGEKDYIANRDEIIKVIDDPHVPALEPIGGTGDVLTGIVSGLIETGWKIDKASEVAAQVNRLAGHYATPTPATQVSEIIAQVPRALREVL